MILTPKQQSTAIHALRVAADQYDRDAKFCDTVAQRTLAKHFDLQAKGARELADALENGPSYEPD